MKEGKQGREQGGIRMYSVGEYYKIIDKVGRGTYGTVYKALGLKDNRFYAIKKLQNNDPKLQQEGFPITALRGTRVIVTEITLLKQIEHPNIIRLKEIILSRPNKRNFYRGSTFLVFEYMDHDFAGLFKMKSRFTLPEIKNIIRQLLEGVAYLHRNKILHRDIKSANILLNDEGDVKLADFGLGRKIKFENLFTYKVVTLWYRAPQLLLGCKTYSDKIDVWSIGCVVAEFFSGEIIFKKQTEFAQMERIYEICGDFQANQMKISEEPLKNCANITDFKPKKPYPRELASYLRKLCPTITPAAIDFLERLLHLDPNKRMSCEEALRHHWFTERPYSCSKSEIQKMQYECHEMFRDNSIKIDRVTFKDAQKVQKRIRDDKYYKEHPRREIYNTRSSSEADKHHKDNSASSDSNSSDYSSSRKNHQERRHRRRNSPDASESRSRSRERKNRYESRPFKEEYRDSNYRNRIKDQRLDYKNNHRDDKNIPKDDKDKYRRKDVLQKDYYHYDKTDKRYKDIKDKDRKEERSEIRQEWRRDSKEKKYDKFDKEKSFDKYDGKSSKFWSQKGDKDQYKRSDEVRDKNYQRDRLKERDRQRQRERERQRDRQKEKERDRERQREKQQQRKRQKDRERQRQKWDERPRNYDRDKYQSRDKYDYSRKQANYDKKPEKFVFVRERGARKKQDRSSSSSKSYSSRSYKKDKEYRHNRYNYDRKEYKRGRSSSEGHHGDRVYKS